MTTIVETAIPGCFVVDALVHEDPRGTLRKPFEAAAFRELGVNFATAEMVWSASKANVIRGLHFQAPPMSSDKIVWCTHGLVSDVVVDLRIGSMAYGTFVMHDLGPTAGSAIFVPTGCAHGFISRESNSIVNYLISAPFSAGDDGGIHWRSIGIDWGTDTPIVSDRDDRLPALADLLSPF